jgi:hypothetical protein
MFQFACEACGKHSRRIAHVMPPDPYVCENCGGRLVRLPEPAPEPERTEPPRGRPIVREEKA